MTLDDEGERVDASAASPMVVGCERGGIKGFRSDTRSGDFTRATLVVE